MKKLLAIAIGVAAAMLGTAALASRNSSGTYTVSSSGTYPFVSGTTINSSTMNSVFSDLTTEMTDSLSRSGKGGMLAPLRGVDGTVGGPAFSFSNETGTGLYRITTADMGLAINGAKTLEFQASTTIVFNRLVVSGGTTQPIALGSYPTWTAISLDAAFTAGAGAAAPSYWQSAGVVYFKGQATCGPACPATPTLNSGAPLAATLRPGYMRHLVGVDTSASPPTPVDFTVDTAGVVRLQSATNGHIYDVSFSYPAEQ